MTDCPERIAQRAVITQGFADVFGFDPTTIAYDDTKEMIVVIIHNATYVMQIGSDDDTYWFRCHHASYHRDTPSYPLTVTFPL